MPGAPRSWRRDAASPPGGAPRSARRDEVPEELCVRRSGLSATTSTAARRLYSWPIAFTRGRSPRSSSRSLIRTRPDGRAALEAGSTRASSSPVGDLRPNAEGLAPQGLPGRLGGTPARLRRQREWRVNGRAHRPAFPAGTPSVGGSRRNEAVATACRGEIVSALPISVYVSVETLARDRARSSPSVTQRRQRVRDGGSRAANGGEHEREQRYSERRRGRASSAGRRAGGRTRRAARVGTRELTMALRRAARPRRRRLDRRRRRLRRDHASRHAAGERRVRRSRVETPASSPSALRRSSRSATARRRRVKERRARSAGGASPTTRPAPATDDRAAAPRSASTGRGEQRRRPASRPYIRGLHRAPRRRPGCRRRPRRRCPRDDCRLGKRHRAVSRRPTNAPGLRGRRSGAADRVPLG